MKTRRVHSRAGIALALAITIGACGARKFESRTIEGPTKTFESAGLLKKVDNEQGRVVLDHDRIGDWMEPMEMPFKVAEASLLDGLEVGRRYAFTIVVAEDDTDYLITKLTPQ